jgi:chemotaxis regulatin CheY-phosphate phosphatase CheZ
MRDEDGKPLRTIVAVAQAISEGDFSKEVSVDATEGLIGDLAVLMNKAVRNFRTGLPSVTDATDKTPGLAIAAQGIAELMESSTKVVLDAAEGIISSCGDCEAEIQKESVTNSTLDTALKKTKELAFEIISAQSYQDTAKQNLAKMEKEISGIRDALIDAVIVMNLRGAHNPEQLNEKRKMLQESSAGGGREMAQKQDLVDDLLAEFGM